MIIFQGCTPKQHSRCSRKRTTGTRIVADVTTGRDVVHNSIPSPSLGKGRQVILRLHHLPDEPRQESCTNYRKPRRDCKGHFRALPIELPTRWVGRDSNPHLSIYSGVDPHCIRGHPRWKGSHVQVRHRRLVAGVSHCSQLSCGSACWLAYVLRSGIRH